MADVVVKDLDDDRMISQILYSDYLENIIDIEAVKEITRQQQELAAAGCQLLYAFVNNTSPD